MNGAEFESDGEYLREVLLDLERARNFERDMRRESESLLAGLQIMALDESGEQMFARLLEALRKIFFYEEAFVLELTQQQHMRVMAATHKRYQEAHWVSCEIFSKALLGEPLAIFNTQLLPDWTSQPTSLRENCRSLLLIPLKGLQQEALLVATHSEIGFFSQHHLSSASRFALLASQALRQSELKEQLHYQQEFNRMILNSLPALVYVQNEQHNVVLANQKAQSMLEAQQLTHHLLSQKIEEQEELVLENQMQTKAGQLRWFHTALKKLRGPNQEHYILGVSTDITLRKEMESTLEKALLSAELANQAKSSFLATMSHELRTPMNAILGFSKILLKRQNNLSAEKNKLFIERIYDNARHLLKLINEILDLSRIEAGEMDYQESCFDLTSLLQGTLDIFEVLAENKQLKLVVQGLEPDIYLRSDRDKLRQIVINLLSNAIKFTHQGEILLRLTVNAEKKPLTITLEDTGIGITQENLDTIFEPFYQVDSGTQRVYPGTGLGLSITQSLCQLLSIELNVESTIGIGTRFQLSF